MTSPDAGPAGQALIVDAHQATVGGMAVRRSLPRRGRRTVGAWCFLDHFGPQRLTATPGAGMQVGPHPHIGLQTVTWLLAGEVLHTDSLGSEQLIRPGQLNVMSAGAGIAQPDGVRQGTAAFAHHPDLPVVELDHGTATVLVGDLAGARSPAEIATELVGADLALRPGRSTLGLRPGFEHAVVPLDGAVALDGRPLEVGRAAVLDAGRGEVALDAPSPARVLVVGGTPFAEPVLMWWNFVARTRAEIDDARSAWEAGSDRFGTVASPLGRIGAPPTPWG